MKALFLSLFVFGTIFILCSALPDKYGKDHQRGPANSDTRNEKSLQKKKPPGTPPGPELIHHLNHETLSRILNTEEPENNHSFDKVKKVANLRANNEDFVFLDKDWKDKPKDKNLSSEKRNSLNLDKKTREEKNTDM